MLISFSGRYPHPQFCSDQPSSSAQQQENMWVDKYRPQIFTDLVGDERVNREVMGWVKEWDQCVFGKKKRKLKRTRKDLEEEEGKPVVEDQWHRPQQKVRVQMLTH